MLEAGLLNGQGVAYAIPEHKLDSESREIERYGIDVDRFPKEHNWQELRKEKRKTGFAELRLVGEMGVFLDYAKSKDLLRYEELFGRQIDPNICEVCQALCLYDTHRLDGEQFVQLNKSHGHSIFKGIASKTT